MPNDEPDADSPPPQPIHLVGGVNFSAWPELKWSRANSHFAALQMQFAEWQASAPISVDGVLREDREAIDLVVRMPHGVPKHEWALTFGDTVHNLRSSLDAVAWGMAHYKDAKPTRPKQVAFPICIEERQWRDAMTTWIGEIDPEFQRRIEFLQPFTHSIPQGASALEMLHALDIQDKHREFVSVMADFHSLEITSHWEYEDHDVDAAPRLEMRSNMKLTDGAVIGTMYTGSPIVPFEKMRSVPLIRMLVEHEGEQPEVAAVLPLLFTEARRCLDILMHGLPAGPPEESLRKPMDVRMTDD